MLVAQPEGATSTADPASAVATSELKIQGMHCNACAIRVERALAKSPSVVSASVNLATNTASVSYLAAATDPSTLCATISAEGYGATEATASSTAITESDPDHWALRAALSWPLSLIALMVSLFATEDATAGWVILVLASLVVVVGGWPFLRTSARLLRHGATSMDTLIAVGTLAALAVSAVEAIALGGRHVHLGGSGQFAARLHGVMAPLIVSILATGRAVEAQMRAKASRAMHSLLLLRPPTARVVADPHDEIGQLVPPESVPVGALVRVRATESVPLDGTVVTGWSSIDESMLTGEPLPVDHGPGSSVTGGTRNGAGALVVRVDAIAAESVLAGMQRLVDDAQRDKPPLQKLADRISAVFVPAVLLLSMLTFLGWWLIGGNFGTAVLSAVAVLLVACPCAMGLATPVAMMVGTGRASALGILVRSGDAFETLAKSDTAIFDKTGTLTERFARVSGVAATNGYSERQLLDLASAVERDSEHPIALAIRSEAPSADGANEVQTHVGLGASGTVDGRLVEVGRVEEAWLPEPLATVVTTHQALGESVVAVRCDGDVIGVIAITSPIRPDAAPAIATLHSMGLTTAILSGDARPAVASVATTVGVDHVDSALSPAGKLDALRAMQRSGRKVVMVGDGVNDAPALAAADVGCAVGSGSEAALSNSDIALLGSDLRGVPAAIGIARSTSSVILQNFGWAMGYNVSALPLAAAGLLDPLVAAIAMGLSSLVVVLNSLRLRRIGRGGVGSIQGPQRTSRSRALALSIAVPIVLFASVIVVAQAVSPARGEPLIPSLPTIITVSLPHGYSAETYLNSLESGPNQLHVFFTSPASGAPVGTPRATAALNSGAPRELRLVRLSRGHFIGFPILSSGTWRFVVFTTLDGSQTSFAVRFTIS